MNASSSPNGDVVAAADSTASDQPPAGPGSDGPKASWIEVAATVVLALAAVATAESPAARRRALRGGGGAGAPAPPPTDV